MSKRPWFPFYTADFLRKTDHLSAEECGCYIRLMRHYWDNNGILQNNPAQLCRIMGVERRRFKSIWLQLDTFFEHHNGSLGDALLLPRLQEELEKTIAISEVKAVSGHKGGLANAKAKKKHMPTHSHSHIKPIDKSIGASAEIPEEKPTQKPLTFWDIGKSIGIPGELIGKACKDHTETAVAKAIATTQIKNPADPKAFFLGLLKANPTEGAQPEWSRIPRDNDAMVVWAGKHGYRKPQDHETYDQYRSYLQSAITLRKDKAA